MEVAVTILNFGDKCQWLSSRRLAGRKALDYRTMGRWDVAPLAPESHRSHIRGQRTEARASSAVYPPGRELLASSFCALANASAQSAKRLSTTCCAVAWRGGGSAMNFFGRKMTTWVWGIGWQPMPRSASGVGRCEASLDVKTNSECFRGTPQSTKSAACPPWRVIRGSAYAVEGDEQTRTRSGLTRTRWPARSTG